MQQPQANTGSTEMAVWNVTSTNTAVTRVTNCTLLTNDLDIICPAAKEGEESCIFYSFIVNFVVIGTLCVCGTVGNMFAFAVFCLDPIKTPTAFLFQALAVVDSLLLLCSFPLYSLDAYDAYTGHLGNYRTHYHPFLVVVLLPCAFVAQTSTIWLTVFVALSRYLAVCKPHERYRLCADTNTPINLALLLVLSIIYNVPRFMESTVQRVVDCATGSTFYWPVPAGLGMAGGYKYVYKNVMYLVFLFIIPLFTLLVLSHRLVEALRDFRRRRATMRFNSSNASSTLSQDNGATVVLIAVVLVFFCCQTPALANQILWNIFEHCARMCGGFQHYFSRLSNALVILNSAVNFLIYYCVNARFKQTFLEKILRRPPRLTIRHDLTALVLLRNAAVRQTSGVGAGVTGGRSCDVMRRTLAYNSSCAHNGQTILIEQ